MKETKLYAKIRPKISDWGICDRVENIVLSGMSDIFYNIDGCVGWLETKVAKGNDIYFEKFQPNWLKKHWRNGFRRLFIVVMDKHESIHVYRAEVLFDVPKRAKSDWIIVSMDDLPDPEVLLTKPYNDWASFRTALIS